MSVEPGPAPSNRRSTRTGRLVAGAGLLLAVFVGVVLRLVDPMSSPVVPAEDPYTHMTLVREHLRTGELNGLYVGADLYPPGLHAFLAAGWVYTGFDLYGIIRMGPVVFGALGILGMGILLWRTVGPVGGFVAALAVAVAPEAIFRSTMMSPTALDLAILPFFLYTILLVLAGKLRWAWVAAPLGVFLTLSHPWLLGILCATGAVFLLFRVLFPWPAKDGERLAMSGIVTAIAILGCSFGIAFFLPSFGGVLNLPRDTDLVPIGFAIAGASLVPALVFVLSRGRLPGDKWLARGPPRLAVRGLLSAGLVAGLAALWLSASKGGLPPQVDLEHMIGLPILLLGAVALAALPFLARPIANLAAAFFVVTLPFVVYNPMDSEFLSHRTAVYLCLAAAALAGVLAGALADHGSRIAHAVAGRVSGKGRATPSRARASPTHGTRTAVLGGPAVAAPSARHSFLAAAIPAVLVSVLLGGSIYAGTPDAYEDGWYRMFTECEVEALRDIAATAGADPDLLVVTGAWQTKTVLAALTEDAQRVWFTVEVYTSERARDDLLANMEREGRPVVFILDRHLSAETRAEAGFVDSPPWQRLGSWCGGEGLQPRVEAFIAGGGSR